MSTRLCRSCGNISAPMWLLTGVAVLWRRSSASVGCTSRTVWLVSIAASPLRTTASSRRPSTLSSTSDCEPCSLSWGLEGGYVTWGPPTLAASQEARSLTSWSIWLPLVCQRVLQPASDIHTVFNIMLISYNTNFNIFFCKFSIHFYFYYYFSCFQVHFPSCVAYILIVIDTLPNFVFTLRYFFTCTVYNKDWK